MCVAMVVYSCVMCIAMVYQSRHFFQPQGQVTLSSLRFYSITKWSCSARRSLEVILQLNRGPLRKSQTLRYDVHRGVFGDILFSWLGSGMSTAELFFILISQPVNQGLRWVRIINNWRSKISWHTPIKNTCTYCACASMSKQFHNISATFTTIHIYLLYYVVKPTCITSAIHWSQVTARLLLQRGLQQQHNTQQQHSTQLAEDHSKSEKYHRLEEIFTRWKSCLLYKYSKN